MSSKFILQQEDGTVENGNARGAYAVDLQMGTRDNSNQVASGLQSTIINGTRNRSSNTQASVINGDLNLASGSQSFVGNGSGNTASGQRSFIGNGFLNIASSDHSVVSGGQSNTASTNTHATVVGGQSNTASGNWAVAGGKNSIASGTRAIAMGDNARATGAYSIAIGESVNATNNDAVAIGGQSCTISGFRSAGIGGFANQINGDYSLGQGSCLLSYLRGQVVFGASNTSNIFSGFEQHSQLLASRLVTISSAATTVLSLDGTGTTNLIIPDGNNRAWNVQVKTVAVVTAITGTATGVSVGDTLMQDDKLLFSKVSGVSSVVGTTSQDFISSTSLGTASMSYSAGASQELALTFTAPTFAGGGSVTMRVVSKVELVEVAF